MPRKTQRSTSDRSARTKSSRTAPLRTKADNSARRDRASKRSLTDSTSTRPRRARTSTSARKRKGPSRSKSGPTFGRRHRLLIVVIGMVLLGYGGVMLGDSIIRAGTQVDSESLGDLWDKVKKRLFDDDVPRVATRPAPAPPKNAEKAAEKAVAPKLDRPAKPLETTPQPKSARAELKAPSNPEDYANATEGDTVQAREHRDARQRLDALLGKSSH